MRPGEGSYQVVKKVKSKGEGKGGYVRWE